MQATRDSTVERRDFASAGGAMRELVFDRAGHFWPTRQYNDPQQVLDQYGLRNQDIEGANVTWGFLRPQLCARRFDARSETEFCTSEDEVRL